MWLSRSSRARLCFKFATIPRVLMVEIQETVFWSGLGCQDATILLIRGVEILGLVFWHGLGLPGRNIYVDLRC
eukprot:8059675-Pyramimonas_sp.AAC.1